VETMRWGSTMSAERYTPEVAKQWIATRFLSITAAFFSIGLYCHLSTIKSSSCDSIFRSTYLCEEAFSQTKAIKSTYRSCLIDEHSNYCRHLCLSNYNPSFSKLSQICSNRNNKKWHFLITVNCVGLVRPGFVKLKIFLISNFRRVLYVVCFLLGNSPASEFYMLTFRNTLSVPSS
jgi:hypothetical protein